MKKDNDGKTIFKKKGRPNLLSDGLMKIVKSIVISTKAAGTAISRRLVMAIRKKVVTSNSPTLLKENVVLLELMEVWAQDVSKSMNRAKSSITI